MAKKSSISQEALGKEVTEALRIMTSAVNIFSDTSNRRLYPTEEDVQVNNDSSMKDLFNSLYQYAIEGHSSKGLFNEEDLHDIPAFLHMAIPAMNFYDCSTPELCMQVYLTASARNKIDLELGISMINLDGHGEDFINGFVEEALTLREISLLANMNEKSVRNATHQTKEDRLETIKIGSGTYVTPKAAIEWLQKRRGFVATKVVKG